MEHWDQTYFIAVALVAVAGLLVARFLFLRRKQAQEFQRDQQKVQQGMLLRGISGVPAPELVPLALAELEKGDALLENPGLTQAVLNILVRSGRVQAVTSFMPKVGARFSRQPWVQDLKVDLYHLNKSGEE